MVMYGDLPFAPGTAGGQAEHDRQRRRRDHAGRGVRRARRPGRPRAVCGAALAGQGRAGDAGTVRAERYGRPPRRSWWSPAACGWTGTPHSSQRRSPARSWSPSPRRQRISSPGPPRSPMWSSLGTRSRPGGGPGRARRSRLAGGAGRGRSHPQRAAGPGRGLLDELCLTLSPWLAGGDANRILDGPSLRAAAGLRPYSVCEQGEFLFLRYRPRRAEPLG
jgi:hypothetical protein